MSVLDTTCLLTEPTRRAPRTVPAHLPPVRPGLGESGSGSAPRRYHRPGAVVSLLAVSALVLPSVLPRDPAVQAVMIAVVALQTYGLTVTAATVLARFRGHRTRTWSAGASRAVGLAVMVALVGSGVIGLQWQERASAAIGVPAPDLLTQTASMTGGVVMAAVLVGLLRMAAGCARTLRRRGRRTGWAAITALAVLTSVLVAGAVHVGSVDHTVKGRQFLAATPTAAEISAVTGRPAVDPVRVYVGIDEAVTAGARARRAVQELRASGGFERALLVVAVPTGTGWVNPAAPAAVEFLHDGDTAVVAQQYSARSSFVAYLGGSEPARDAATALLAAVQAEVGRRARAGLGEPTVVVTGESLGALGGLQATTGTAGRPTGLWVGVPAQVHDLLRAGQHALVHADDPVAAWSPQLLWRPTATRALPWFPLVSFWQATGDLVGAARTPFGFGHRYSQEYLDGWLRAAPGRWTPTPAVTRAIEGALSSRAR